MDTGEGGTVPADEARWIIYGAAAFVLVALVLLASALWVRLHEKQVAR